MIHYTIYASPVGSMIVAGTDLGIAGVYFEDHKHFDGLGSTKTACWSRNDEHPVLLQAKRELDEYFAGQRRHFDVALDPAGTPFQRNVWTGLRAIAYGATSSYGQLADAIGNRGAVRAVGAANGRNPISIIVPCHRVIGSTGDLVGYAGGLERKRYLLALEQMPEQTAA